MTVSNASTHGSAVNVLDSCQNGRQIDEATLHRNVRRIDGPDLIRAIDGEVTQQVGMVPVRLVPSAGVGFAIEGLNTHLLHPCANVFAADHHFSQPEHVVQHARTGKGLVQMQFFNSGVS